MSQYYISSKIMDREVCRLELTMILDQSFKCVIILLLPSSSASLSSWRGHLYSRLYPTPRIQCSAPGWWIASAVWSEDELPPFGHHVFVLRLLICTVSYKNVSSWAIPVKQVSSRTCRHQRPRSDCASVQSNQGCWCLLGAKKTAQLFKTNDVVS